MVMVCKNHVTKGLHVLPTPHVKQIPEKIKECCVFCNGHASYQLFTLSSSATSTVPKAEKVSCLIVLRTSIKKVSFNERSL